MSQRQDHERLTRIYDDYGRRVYAYALRHCGPNDADDVLSETFAIAWRRRDVLPAEPLGWLLITARNVISGSRRADQRRTRLAEVLADDVDMNQPAVDELVVHRQELLTALDSLSDREREALLLVAWDGLEIRDAAAVAGCTPRAFRARLMRARARLAASMLPMDTSDSKFRNLPNQKGLHYENRPASV